MSPTTMRMTIVRGFFLQEQRAKKKPRKQREDIPSLPGLWEVEVLSGMKVDRCSYCPCVACTSLVINMPRSSTSARMTDE
jgi:hypothetical protein